MTVSLSPATVGAIVDGYVAAAAWLAIFETEDVAAAGIGPVDIDDTERALMARDVDAFLSVLADLEYGWALEDAIDALGAEGVGHDFYLTRNHHGAGYWDRGLGQTGDVLTGVAVTFGDASVMVDANGDAFYE
jgi:hypothetical protein